MKEICRKVGSTRSGQDGLDGKPLVSLVSGQQAVVDHCARLGGDVRQRQREIHGGRDDHWG